MNIKEMNKKTLQLKLYPYIRISGYDMSKLLEINTFKALSEEIRLRIMVLLASGELCVCDLIEVLGLPQSTISRHIGRLKSADMVNDRRNGKWVFYSIASFTEVGTKQILPLLNELKSKEPYKSDSLKLAEYKTNKNCESEIK